MAATGIGIIGCGVISGAYLAAARNFPVLDIRGLADIDQQAAEKRAAEFGLRAVPVGALLADPEIDIVVNLTIPAAHLEVGKKALAAGKHVYAEKPLGVTFAEGRELIAFARDRGLRVGSAPDTFLGGAHQQARRMIDDGAVGTPVGGTAFFMCPGHERWHPAPGFYYRHGAGPMFDMGPYYITDLVNLLGPVAEIAGFSGRPRRSREIFSAPLKGEMMPVEVDTHVAGLLAFECGALVQIGMSFDVEAHRHLPLEIYGTGGTLIVPDPNHFGGTVEHRPAHGEWQESEAALPFADGNYRSLGVADMAGALQEGRPHRASGELALHVLEVMEAVQRASDTRSVIAVETRAERPAPLGDGPAWKQQETGKAS